MHNPRRRLLKNYSTRPNSTTSPKSQDKKKEEPPELDYEFALETKEASQQQVQKTVKAVRQKQHDLEFELQKRTSMKPAPKEVWILFQDTVGLSNIVDPRTFQVKQSTKDQGWTFEPEQQEEIKTMINDRRPDVIIMNPDSSMWEEQVEQAAWTPHSKVISNRRDTTPTTQS